MVADGFRHHLAHPAIRAHARCEPRSIDADGHAEASGSEGDDESDGESELDAPEPNPCALSLPDGDGALPITVEGSWLE